MPKCINNCPRATTSPNQWGFCEPCWERPELHKERVRSATVLFDFIFGTEQIDDFEIDIDLTELVG